jgi:hypothetical protein
VTLGLKVLHIERKANLKKRRFEPLDKPFRIALYSFGGSDFVSKAAAVSRFAMHSRHCVAFCARRRGAFMVR